MTKVALITGISGQDGSLLSKLLIKNNYKVVGLVSEKNSFKYDKLEYLSVGNKVSLEEANLLDYEKLYNVFEKHNPSKVFNFASQSSVGASYLMPKETLEFNIQSVVNLLECIRNNNSKTRLFQASSSEIFGNVKSLPVNELTAMNPNNLYGISKVGAHNIIKYYREYYKIYVATAIFFNHESVLRGDNFVIKKIIRDLHKVKHGQLKQLTVGNIDTKRDFGYAPKYMEAVYNMLLIEKGEDYVIASGQSRSIREIIRYVLDKLGLDESIVVVDKALFRVNDISDIYGDSTKAHEKLKWEYNTPFNNVLDEMIRFEGRMYRNEL